MVRAGKTGKGFTPPVAHHPQKECTQNTALVPGVASKIREQRSAILIQKAWRRTAKSKRASKPEVTTLVNRIGNPSGRPTHTQAFPSKIECLKYGQEICIERLMQNLAARVLDARPERPALYLIHLLELMKPATWSKEGGGKVVSSTDQTKRCRAARSEPERAIRTDSVDSSKAYLKRMNGNLGIFDEQDLQVLYDYCNKKGAAGVTKALKRLSSTTRSHSSLACSVLQLADNSFSAQKPSLLEFTAVAAAPIKEFFLAKTIREGWA